MPRSLLSCLLLLAILALPARAARSRKAATTETFWRETPTHRIKIKVRGRLVLGRWKFARNKGKARPKLARKPARPRKNLVPARPARLAGKSKGAPALALTATTPSPPSGPSAPMARTLAGWASGGLLLLGVFWAYRTRDRFRMLFDTARQRAFEGFEHPFWGGEVGPSSRRKRAPSAA